MSTPAARVKVLLVDDLTANLVALEALLADEEVEPITCTSGTQALESLLEHDIALALLDVQMPEMDGFELAELMRGAERTKHIPIIFLTAGAHERGRLFRGYDAGAVDVLFKPIEPHVLRHKVRTFVGMHRQRVELADRLVALQQSEAEARALKDELGATLKLNETFLAAIGHDLKNPLNAILMASELLLGPACSEPDRIVLQRARTSARRMANMIDQLHDLSRARLAGGIPLLFEDGIDLAKVVEQAVEELRMASPGHSVELSVWGDTMGSWDSERIARVLSNLLGNAVRHGKPKTAVSVELDGSGAEEVRLAVQNAGVIPEEVKLQIFEPFGKKESRGGRGEGLGLGLFIVAQVIDGHGGHIEVQTAEGHTTFTIRLPRRRCSELSDG